MTNTKSVKSFEQKYFVSNWKSWQVVWRINACHGKLGVKFILSKLRRACDSVTPLVTPRFNNRFVFSILRRCFSSWSSIPSMVYHGAVFFRHIWMKQHKLELMTLFDNWNLEWADDLTSQLLVYQFIVTSDNLKVSSVRPTSCNQDLWEIGVFHIRTLLAKIVKDAFD